ncbi:FAD-binding oxidoreductase [Candidatus Saccharibacteria bacterium]|nr:MAG: FAD-binding oxidoreductase [Candidatus Saccharibacteria bacterium]
MDGLKEKLVKHGFLGGLDDSPEAKEFYSHDASMFELRPQLVAQPKDAVDVQRLVRFVASNKKKHPELSSLAALLVQTWQVALSMNPSSLILQNILRTSDLSMV